MAVGVFDSGIGGLSVLQHLMQQSPDEYFVYVADSQHAPYGNKSEQFIQQRCLEICRFLIEQQVSVIVVACNTATAAAVKTIREHVTIPVVAIEPALKPASLKTKTGKVGVLATASTLQSQQYNSLVSRYAVNISCYEQAAHGLVELIEAGRLDDPQTEALLRQYLQPMLQQGVDSVVLGCTHYPFVLDTIQKITGPEVSIIDTGSAVAGQLKRVLSEQNQQHLTAPMNALKQHLFYSSGDIQHAREMIGLLMGQAFEVTALSV
ncbi:MAG: glutamate racemase [Gammaproteobacteria bacterium]|nr:glutamate racemase [Gammaproteobacteria bacterium]